MKAIITDCDHANIDIERKIFSEAGISLEHKNARTEDEIIEQCKGAEIFIVQYGEISEKVMKALPELKYVVRYGVGVDTVDVEAATKYGVQVGNVPDYGMNEVADQAVSLTLTFGRKILIMNEYTKTEKWDYTNSIPVRRFSTQTIGVVGIGRIGSNYAKKVAALGFNVIGYDPSLEKIKKNAFIKPVSFEELIEKSDVISIHCPADGNKDLFNEEVFKKMKKSSILINTARGGIINEKDLDEALKNGEIAGAALDCMASEPMSSDSEIFKNKNLIVTPHMAWYSQESALELKRKVAEESVRFAKGESIHYPINKLKK